MSLSIPTNSRTSQILFSVALEAAQHGMISESDILLAKALEIANPGCLVQGADYAAKLIQFADLCTDLNRLDKAESLYRNAIKILEKYLGIEHQSTALAMRSLADICSRQGKEPEAADLRMRALLILANNHPSTKIAPSPALRTDTT